MFAPYSTPESQRPGVATDTPLQRALREQQAVMASKAFLEAHPDLKHRTEGFLRLEEGRTEDARKSFLEAALFADKPSQAVLAEMAWKGIGQPTDRPRAYAWADISAERGYPPLVAIRESYWEQLSDEEKERAIEIGQSLMDEYGDEVAKARMALLEQQNQGVVDLHRGWIEALLVEYYDPMYAFPRENKAGRIEFVGEQADVVAFLRQRAHS